MSKVYYNENDPQRVKELKSLIEHKLIPDCGHEGIYWKGSKNKPVWLVNALDELGI